MLRHADELRRLRQLRQLRRKAQHIGAVPRLLGGQLAVALPGGACIQKATALLARMPSYFVH